MGSRTISRRSTLVWLAAPLLARSAMPGSAFAQQATPLSGITFHMLERGARADANFRARLLRALEKAAGKAQSQLPTFNVDVVVFENRFGVIPRIGVNGQSSYSSKIEITYDSTHPTFLARAEEHIGSTLAHELHHHARGAKYGRSLGSRLVSEGLACVFEEECGYPPPFYAIECTGAALRDFSQRALPLLDRSDLNFGNWMFGELEKKDGEFPYQGGYSLGYALVKAWLAHAGTTAAKAYDVEAKTVLDAWRSGAINPVK